MRWRSMVVLCLAVSLKFGWPVILEERCQVVSTMTDVWLNHDSDDETRIRLPKVRVQVVSASDVMNFSDSFATRFGRQYSESPPLTYENGTSTWLESFAAGTTVPCWVNSATPDDITLQSFEAPNPLVAWIEFAEDKHHTLLMMGGCLLLALCAVLICIIRYRDPGVDVRFPQVRTWCFRLYPWTLLFSYFAAWVVTMQVSSKKLEHKFYQPLLFGILLFCTIIYFYVICNPFCARLLPTNMTLVLGVPCYFSLIWTILFVTLVPKFSWLHEGHNIVVYGKLAIMTFKQLTASLFHIVLIVIFLTYRERIMRAFGIEGGKSFGDMWHDLVDPFYRRRSFIGVKIALLDIVGKLPTRFNPTGTNNLMVTVQCDGSEAVATRVHPAQPGDTPESKVYRFHEVCQVNIPMEPESPDLIYFKVFDQGVLSTDEIARVVLSVAEVFDYFFSGQHDGRRNLDVELHLGGRIAFTDRQSGKPMEEIEKCAMPLELQCKNFRGPAYLWLAFLPANDKAEQYIKSVYKGGCCSWLSRLCSKRSGSGPEDLMGSSYEPLVKVMEMEATRPLTSRRPGAEAYSSVPSSEASGAENGTGRSARSMFRSLWGNGRTVPPPQESTESSQGQEP